MTAKQQNQPTNREIIISFPAPHTRPRASTNMMIGWGYYTWAKEMVEEKFGLKLEHQPGRYANQFSAKLPDHFDFNAFSRKLNRFYNTSVFMLS